MPWVDGALGGDDRRAAFKVADLLAGDEGILSAMVNGSMGQVNGRLLALGNRGSLGSKPCRGRIEIGIRDYRKRRMAGLENGIENGIER